MRVVIFEDDGIEGFGPLTLLRHVGLLRRGTKSLLDAIVEKIPDARDVVLWGRPELSAVTKEGTGKAYNEKVYGPALLVNARARPTEGLLLQASLADPFVAVSGGELVAARLDTVPLKPGPIGRSVVRTLARRTKKLAAEPDPLFRGYWDLLEGNGLAIASQATRNEESLDLPRSVEVRGPSGNIMVDAGAEIEGQVTLDARLGPIVIKKGASVECFSRIMGPCYIGSRTMVFSALIGGGTSIFETCKVGGQIENSVILPYTNKAHHGYVGDSYVGSWVNIGAGCTFSNMKNTYGNVRVSTAGKRVDTGMLKLGPAVGDMAKLSIGSLVYAGKFVGAGSHVSGLVEGDVSSFTFSSSSKDGPVALLLDSVIETQRRMMERRGLVLSRSEEALIRKAHGNTEKERRKAGAREGPIR